MGKIERVLLQVSQPSTSILIGNTITSAFANAGEMRFTLPTSKGMNIKKASLLCYLLRIADNYQIAVEFGHIFIIPRTFNDEPLTVYRGEVIDTSPDFAVASFSNAVLVDTFKNVDVNLDFVRTIDIQGASATFRNISVTALGQFRAVWRLSLFGEFL
jgi:hypothetical protein